MRISGIAVKGSKVKRDQNLVSGWEISKRSSEGYVGNFGQEGRAVIASL